MRKFAQCMRDNGVDMQDPKDGRVEIKASAKSSAGGGPKLSDPTIEAAQKKCAHLMPNGGKPRKPSSAELATMRAYSKCMRDHGVTAFPDPNPDGGMQLRAGKGTGIDPQSQTFKDADKACQKYQPDGGKITWGHEASRGYLPQDHEGQIKPGTTAADWLKGWDVKAYDQDVRALLGRMLFSGEEGMKPTATLSGGETVRLLMCKLMLLKDNVLILDEPTNHLDLESISALGEGLEKYEGTAIVATHDRDMVSRFATRIIYMRGNGEIIDFTGKYDEFVAKYPNI